MSTETRIYRKRRRAEAEQRTRLRITQAAVKLHGTVGPARTTVSAVAQEAGVQRATVYSHFPTGEELFEACSSHWLAQNPLPDIGGWAEVADPDERLERGLSELYAWYRRTAGMLERTSRDAPLVPAMSRPMAGFAAAIGAARDVLLEGRPGRGAARRRTRAALGHAMTFTTWQSLVRDQGLDERQAVALMAAMVEAAAAAGD